MKIKALLKLLTPPLMVQAYRYCVARCHFRHAHLTLYGDYASWAEARKASTGYDTETILEKTRTALLKVRNGAAAYERDSVLFDVVQYSWPLLAGLMWFMAKSGEGLNVLDFGGSLGSTYFQNRVFLDRLPQVRWNIVEQPSYVHVGKKDFQDGRLKFYLTTQDCLGETQPNVIILSSVLQYLEGPYVIVGELTALGSDCIIVDRTPFWDGHSDRLCVQHVPPSIYSASYPCWIFSRQRFLSRFTDVGFKTVVEFLSNDNLPGPVNLSWGGMLLYRSQKRVSVTTEKITGLSVGVNNS